MIRYKGDDTLFLPPSAVYPIICGETATEMLEQDRESPEYMGSMLSELIKKNKLKKKLKSKLSNVSIDTGAGTLSLTQKQKAGQSALTTSPLDFVMQNPMILIGGAAAVVLVLVLMSRKSKKRNKRKGR